jgi:ABC-type dipeptide/oligopeptide/nickel transport system permease subunit
VEAAVATGASGWRVLLRHVLPNMAAVLVVLAAFETAAMILYEAGVGFLGLSVPPTVPSWGNMLADGRNYLTTSWWIATFPGLAILGATLGINLLGDWLRQL